MSLLLLQAAHFVKGIDPVADVFDTVQSTDVVDMGQFEVVTFAIMIGVGATGTQTITVEACDDTVPTNVTAVPFFYRQILATDVEGSFGTADATGFSITAGSSKIVLVSIHSAALASLGYRYVRMKSTEVVNSPVLGGVLIILTGGRDQRDLHPTAI